MAKSIQELEECIKNLQAEFEELKENTMEKEKKDSPWALSDVNGSGYFVAAVFTGEYEEGIRYTEGDFNAFKTEETAKGFANAFHVMIALRQCEGAGETDKDDEGFYLTQDGYSGITTSEDWESFCVCPPFPSEELLMKAVEEVGEDKIIAAYEFLATGEGE